MGAHTLGRMNTENSGHSGPWLPGNEKQTFSNKYYSSMLDNNHVFTGRVRVFKSHLILSNLTIRPSIQIVLLVICKHKKPIHVSKMVNIGLQKCLLCNFFFIDIYSRFH